MKKIDMVTCSESFTLLIEMTNEYIDYRNQVFDGCCIYETEVIPEDEDEEYILMMDAKIQRVQKFLKCYTL